jgi:hypothetical protein
MFSVAVASFGVRRFDAAFERQGSLNTLESSRHFFAFLRKSDSKPELHEKGGRSSSHRAFPGFVAGRMRYSICIGTAVFGRPTSNPEPNGRRLFWLSFPGRLAAGTRHAKYRGPDGWRLFEQFLRYGRAEHGWSR